MLQSNFDIVDEKFVGCCIAIQNLIKTRTFFRKAILIEKNIRSHDVLNFLNSIKFLDILNSNKTPNIFSTYQLKISFKHLSFARKQFLMCFKIRTSLGLKLNF